MYPQPFLNSEKIFPTVLTGAFAERNAVSVRRFAGSAVELVIRSDSKLKNSPALATREGGQKQHNRHFPVDPSLLMKRDIRNFSNAFFTLIPTVDAKTDARADMRIYC